LLEIRGGTVITMNAQREILENAVVRVENGRIIEICSVNEPVKTGADVVDAKGCLVLPGLVNTHTHAAMTLLRSYADDVELMDWLEHKIWPAEDRLTSDDVYWGTRLAIQEMVLGGTTTFLDMYYFMEDILRASEESGVRAVLSRGLVGGPDAEKSLQDSVDFYQKWNGTSNGRIRVMLAPHAPYTCPPEFMRDISAVAGDLDCGIHVHLAETETEEKQILGKYGMRPFEYLVAAGMLERKVIAAHCVWLNSEEIAEIAKHTWGVAHNPISNLKLASGVALVPEMVKLGIPVGLGTDGAASNNRLDIWSEMKLAAVLHKGVTRDPMVIPADTALAMATIEGARALGMEDEIGSLELGKRADLILVDINKSHLAPLHDPISLLVYAATKDDVFAVMIDGKWVVKDGRFLPFEEEEAIATAQKISQRLVSQ
jgi:5-methylthioadenosine/S-adenosylhomocysteine deaminase